MTAHANKCGIATRQARLIYALLLALLTFSSFLTRPSASHSSTPAQSTTFTAAGQVISTVGAPITGVTLTFTRLAGSGGVPNPVQTDQQGRWSQSGFAADSVYRVTPSQPGTLYTPSFHNFGGPANDLVFQQTLDPFTIAGRVIAVTGTPIAGVTVTFTRTAGTGAMPAPVVTDLNGRWTQTGFRAGSSYRATPSYASYLFSPPTKDFSGPLTDIIFQHVNVVPNPQTLSGQVITPVGAPVAGVTISFALVSGNEPAPPPVLTDGNGQWQQSGFRANTLYQVTAVKDGCAITPAFHRTTAPKHDLIFSATAQGFGAGGQVVTIVGQPMSGVTLTFARVTGGGALPAPAQTDANGRWQQTGFAAGTVYRVTPSKPGFIFIPETRTFSGPINDLNFLHRPDPFTVSGQALTPSGGPLAGVTITFSRLAGAGATPAPVQTDAQGNWSQTGFRANSVYRITASKTGVVFTPATIDVSDSLSEVRFTGFSPTSATFTLLTNRTDPLLLRATNARGDLVEFFGERDPDGKPRSLTNIVVNATDGKTYRYQLDAQGRPVLALLPNGVTFRLEWLNATEFVLTAISADGALQVNTAINLAPKAQLAAKAPPSTAAASGRKGIPTMLQVTAPEKTHLTGLADLNAAQNGAGQVFISAKLCGFPYSANTTAFVDAFDPATGRGIGSFPARLVGAGLYAATLPTPGPPPAPSKLPDWCSAIEDVLDVACNFAPVIGTAAPVICATLAAALAKTGVGALASAPVFEACLAFAVGIELYCNSLGFSPVPGAPSVADQLCNALREDRAPTPNVTLRATVWLDWMRTTSAPVTVPATLPFPVTLAVESLGRPLVESFITRPSRPGTFDDYVATAVASCLTPGTQVDLAIVGTDGYFDNKTFFVEQAGTHEFNLAVPGADTGIEDTITIVIRPPQSAGFTRIISIVFGA